MGLEGLFSGEGNLETAMQEGRKRMEMHREAVEVVEDGRDGDGDDIHSEKVLEDGVAVDCLAAVGDDVGEEVPTDERHGITTSCTTTVLERVQPSLHSHQVDKLQIGPDKVLEIRFVKLVDAVSSEEDLGGMHEVRVDRWASTAFATGEDKAANLFEEPTEGGVGSFFGCECGRDKRKEQALKELEEAITARARGALGWIWGLEQSSGTIGSRHTDGIIKEIQFQEPRNTTIVAELIHLHRSSQASHLIGNNTIKWNSNFSSLRVGLETRTTATTKIIIVVMFIGTGQSFIS